MMSFLSVAILRIAAPLTGALALLSLTLDGADARRFATDDNRTATEQHAQTELGAENAGRSTGVAKEITFVRHGESAGNQGKKHPLKYLWENSFDIYAFRDGRLTQKGEEDVISQALALDDGLVRRIMDAEVLMVSPLQRAMATAVILLAVVNDRGCTDFSRHCKGRIPIRVVVDENLREKVGSGSDVPSENPDVVSTYLEDVAKRMSLRNFNTTVRYRHLVDSMMVSYSMRRIETNGWSDFVPSNAIEFVSQINYFRKALVQDQARKVLVVGHNGWSRWAFSAGLPAPTGETDEFSLTFGARVVTPLCNSGFLTAHVDESGFFSDVHRHSKIGATCSKKGKIGVFPSVGEAIAAGVVPAGGKITRVMMKKVLDYRGEDERLITFSSSTNGLIRPAMAWSDKMGDPKKFIYLGVWDVKATFNTAEMYVDIADAKGDLIEVRSYDGTPSRVQPFRLRASNEADWIMFKTQWDRHRVLATRYKNRFVEARPL